MTYSQIRAFHAVARVRSFSKAATLLRVTQPAVTLQVQALEKAYGVSLIQRGKGVLALTSLGRAMFEATQRFFAEEERVYELISKSSALEIGTVRLGADGPHVALDIVSSFRARYPRVDLQVVLGNADVIWEDILGQHVDAAILANPRPDRRVHIEPICTQDMVVLVPADDPLARRQKLRLRDLKGQPVIFREPGSNTQRTLLRALNRAGIHLKPTLELGSREAVLEAVARGLGIGFVFEQESGRDERMVAIPLEGLEASNHDTFVCLKRQLDRRPVRALMDIAKESRAKIGNRVALGRFRRQ